MGKTHAELMTGELQPLSGIETTEWMAFSEIRNELTAKKIAQAERQQQRLTTVPGRRTR